MLVAGAVTCIITFVRNFSILGKLEALLLVLVIFYFLGSVLRWTLDSFDRQNEEKNSEEAEAIEKDTEGREQDAAEEVV